MDESESPIWTEKSEGSDRGFIYTIFGLGASHMGIWAGLLGKACPARPMGFGPRPIFEGPLQEVGVRQIVEHGKIGRQ